MNKNTFSQTAEYVKLAEISYVNFREVDLTDKSEVKKRMMYEKNRRPR